MSYTIKFISFAYCSRDYCRVLEALRIILVVLDLEYLCFMRIPYLHFGYFFRVSWYASLIIEI